MQTKGGVIVMQDENTKRRYIQVYTGNGKGKTTAAIGQAIRAVGNGWRILFIMFMKNYPYGELAVLQRLGKSITIEQYGDDSFVLRKEPPSPADIQTAQKAIKRVESALISGDYDMIILDEICVANYFGLVSIADGLTLLQSKPPTVELVLTGRYCPEAWLEKADLITEMKEIKHYYRKGITARKGIES